MNRPPLVFGAVALLLAAVIAGSNARAQAPQAVGTWAGAVAIGDGRSGAAAVALPDGRTLVLGGVLTDGTPTASTFVVDPASHTVAAAGTLARARAGHGAARLDDGRVVVAGGTVDGAVSAEVELFDPATGAAIVATSLAEARTGIAATTLPDGRVLFVGGTSAAGAVLASVEVFDPVDGTVLPFGVLNAPRTGASATTLLDGRVLVAGGFDGVQDLASAEISAPDGGFDVLPTALGVARHGHTALRLADNNVVVIAGGTSAGTPDPGVDLFLPPIYPDPYELSDGEFAATGALTAARSGGFGGAAGAGLAFVSGGGAGSDLYRFATLTTDKNDYAPGEHAVIAGTGWQPGEVVTLLFHETPAVHEDYVQSVMADQAGNIYLDRWAPEEHDLNVRFYLTAMDSVSRAQVTFTDARRLDPVGHA